MSKTIAFIGLELEGVMMKDGFPSRIPEKFRTEYADTYDCLAEVRTRPMKIVENQNSKEAIYDIINSLLGRISTLESVFATEGLRVTWDEVLIPAEVHEAIMKSVKFEPRLINSAITGTQKLKDASAFSSDRYRGGGLHVNMSFLKSTTNMEACARMFVYGLVHPSSQNGGLPWRSLYRKPGQWRPVRYEGTDGFVDGFEYRSLGINMTAAGIIHLAHIIERAITIATSVSK